MKTVLFLLLAYHGEIDSQYLQHELEKFYHVKCIVKTEGEIPNSAFDKQTQKYSASKILRYQQAKYNQFFTISLTSKHIAINKYAKDGRCDWGIGGLSYLGKQNSVVSVYLMKNKERVVTKVLLHEFGHGLGLPHCESKYGCMMKDVKGRLSNMNHQPKDLCILCRNKLKILNEPQPFCLKTFFYNHFK